jgi:nitrous oxidase accessory protein NosD
MFANRTMVDGKRKDRRSVRRFSVATAVVSFVLVLIVASHAIAATVTVGCGAGGALASALAGLKPGDVLLVQGMCRESIVIPADLHDITVDGQGKATVAATDARRPAIQVLGREITIKGLTVTGGQFGIAINRGATAIVENNTLEEAALSGLEVSQNSFGRIINNTMRHNKRNGILVLGSASVHIGVLQTGDRSPQPNIIENNGSDGIMVIRSSTARIIGNMLSGNGRNGLTVQQASHADVAGNVISDNTEHGIRVTGNSGVNLADSAMRVFEQPNATAAPNGGFGIKCEIGAYIEGALGSLVGRGGAKDVSDTSCINRATP